MFKINTKLPIDTWVAVTREEYLQAIETLNYEKAKCYYHNGKLRIDMSPVSSEHSKAHSIIIVAASLYASIKGIAMNGYDNCTLHWRKC